MIASLLVAAALSACPQVPGLAAVVESGKPGLIWVGEFHGTTEQPALFADMVCTVAAASGRQVVVGLERTKSEQDAWNRYLASDGGPKARAALTEGNGSGWGADVQDGRNSQAMLALADRLLKFHQQGLVSDVKMIMPYAIYKDQNKYEISMSKNVSEIRKKYPSETTIIYTGSLHARKAPMEFDGKPLTFAAADLKRPPFSILLRSGAGMTWACESSCGPNAYEPKGANVRGVSAVDVPQGYDLIVYTGTLTTVSRPAVRADLK